MAPAQPPRKRLRTKTPAPSVTAGSAPGALAQPVVLPTASTSTSPSTAGSECGSVASCRAATKSLWHLRVRNFQLLDQSSAAWDVKRARARAKVASLKGRPMAAAEVRQIENNFKETVDASPALRALLSNKGDSAHELLCRRKLSGYNGLLTWNGPWGLIPYDGLLAAPPPEYDYAEELDSVVAGLRQRPEFRALWASFDERMRDISNDL